MLRRLFEWTMAKAAHRHAEWWLALFAFMEASFFPIPPHPLLGIMCLAEPKKAVRFAAIATIARLLPPPKVPRPSVFRYGQPDVLAATLAAGDTATIISTPTTAARLRRMCGC